MPAMPELPSLPTPDALRDAALRRGVALLNRLLGDAAHARLAAHAGKRAELRVAGAAVELVVDAGGAFALAAAAQAGAPALRVDADLAELLAARLRGQHVGGVHIAGDAEFAQALAWGFEHLELDVEDELAPWLGDIAAHRVGRALHGARERGRRAQQRLADEARAWLAAAPRLLVARAEFDATAAAVARLRDAAARLDKRIALLQRRPRS